MLVLAVGCGGAAQAGLSLWPRTRLEGTDGKTHGLPSGQGAALTVLVFFSAHCDCQAAHDARLAELERKYRGLGVAFFAVDSEVGAALGRDAQEAQRRAYPYPILIDPRAELARALGAEYATYTVVLDARGRVRYRGGIDSDLAHLRTDAVLYLRDALDDLLAGRAPRRAYGEALGCALLVE
jgi:peroxiredoxin